MLVEDTEQPFLDVALDSPLAQLSGAAVRYVITVGPQAGRATMRLLDPAARDDTPEPSKPFTVARDGFSLILAPSPAKHTSGPNSNGSAATWPDPPSPKSA